MDEHQSKQYDTMQGRDALQKMHAQYTLLMFVALVLLGISVPVFLISMKYGIIPLAIALIVAFRWLKILKQYTAAVKDIAGQTLRTISYLSEVSYEPEGGFNQADILSLGFLKKASEYKMGDLVSAKCNDIPFKLCDLKMSEQKKTSNGSTTTSQFFKGKFIVFNLKKQFDTSAIIYSNTFKGIGNGIPDTVFGMAQPAAPMPPSPAPAVAAPTAVDPEESQYQDAVEMQINAQIAAEEAAAAAEDAAENGIPEEAADDGTPKPFVNVTKALIGGAGKFQVLSANGKTESNIFVGNLFSNLMVVSQQLKAPFALMFKGNKIFVAINDNKDMFEVAMKSSVDFEHQQARIREELSFLPLITEQIAEQY